MIVRHVEPKKEKEVLDTQIFLGLAFEHPSGNYPVKLHTQFTETPCSPGCSGVKLFLEVSASRPAHVGPLMYPDELFECQSLHTTSWLEPPQHGSPWALR